MLTPQEVRKLQSEMRRELEGRPAALWKCAAGLVVVASLGIIGAVDITAHEQPGTMAAVSVTAVGQR